MRRSFSRLLVFTASCAALTLPAAAEASPSYAVDGLRVQAPIGAFGGIRVGSCDLVTYAGCKIKTFTVENLGSDSVFIGGFGISDLDPLTAALVPGAPATGCEFLPIVGGYWSLQPGASCTLSVAFNPVEKGRAENELRIWSTDQSEPIAVIPLSGVGT